MGRMLVNNRLHPACVWIVHVGIIHCRLQTLQSDRLDLFPGETATLSSQSPANLHCTSADIFPSYDNIWCPVRMAYRKGLRSGAHKHEQQQIEASIWEQIDSGNEMTIFTSIFEKLTELIFLCLIMEELQRVRNTEKYFTYCSWIGKICIFVTVYNGDGVYGFFTVPSDTPLDIEIQPQYKSAHSTIQLCKQTFGGYSLLLLQNVYAYFYVMHESKYKEPIHNTNGNRKSKSNHST